MNIRRFGGQPIFSLAVSFCLDVSRETPMGRTMRNGTDLLLHVVASGLDLFGVVDDPVRDSVGMDANPLMQYPLQTLHVEHR